ncbi:unnamed protein product [Chironomus riparius]|uniref:Uncharacterized protein n=1 Tax=Chironomus riparius TaxID=315576 RepID=A0A9N9S3Z9_9DIPT|nr:unnamed protein product [Chironomus riparius]
MSSVPGNQYVNLYFFKNGSVRKPEKIRRRKNEIEKLVSKKGKSCYYREKIIYTICGEPVTTLSKFVNNSPFVLVEPEDSFKPQKYSQIFIESLQEASNNQCSSRSSMNNSTHRKSLSTPAIPVRTRKSSESCVKFTTVIEEHSSDDEFCRESLTNNKRKEPSKQSYVKPLPQQSAKMKKEGIFAHCCVKAQPSQNLVIEPFIACNNDKITQTTPQDFKCAKERKKREEQDQKKREKVYKKAPIQKTGSTPVLFSCPREDFEDECEDPKLLSQHETAREQFFKKRNAMALKIKKSLDKKYGIELRHGEC